jgi:zinc transport system ATP-binding protein
MTSRQFITINNISFAYGNHAVLADVTLDIEKGDYLGIIGSNGAGKTTLLKIILGLLKPSKGSVQLFGKDIKKFKEWPRIGYLPQNVARFDQNFPATVQEVVMMGRYGRLGLFRAPLSKDREAVKNALTEVNMWEFKDRLIGELSGGQQQRVFIARALASEPEIIFLDEPTVGIDQESRTDFYSLLHDLNKHHGLTLVLISHDVKIVLEEAKRIAYIDQKLVFCGPSKDFLKHKKAKDMLEEHLHLDQPRHL